MKANELMIGNYVKDPYGKVIGLVSVDADASMLTPIPLTEEWLLSFGFESNFSENEDGQILTDGWKISVGEGTWLTVETDWSCGLENPKMDALVLFKNHIIKYIHQLQNLYFALTGEELTLKN